MVWLVARVILLNATMLAREVSEEAVLEMVALAVGAAEVTRAATAV